jgi:hypothetical protein
MQLPADSFAYTPFKKIRSPKGRVPMSEVRCQISDFRCEFLIITLYLTPYFTLHFPHSHPTSQISHLVSGAHAEVFHKRDPIDLMKRGNSSKNLL